MPKTGDVHSWYSDVEEAKEKFKSWGTTKIFLTESDIQRLQSGDVLAIGIEHEYAVVLAHDSKHTIFLMSFLFIVQFFGLF